jgi:HEAT repeat protein
VQVRVEALRVLSRMDDTQRTAAFARALGDENERVVVLALQELTESSAERGQLPEPLVSQIMALVDGGKQSEPVRARAIRTLLFTRSDTVREWLINLVSRKSVLLRRMTLVEPTQPAVSALHVLTKVYAHDPAAAGVRVIAAKVAADPRWQVRDTGSTPERTT